MKTISIVNRTLSTKLGIDLKTVEKVNQCYWKAVVDALRNLSVQPVHIKKIGTIVASPRKTKDLILNIIKQIRYIRQHPTYKQQTKDKLLAVKYTDLKALLIKRNQIAIEENGQRAYKHSRWLLRNSKKLLINE